MAQVLYVVGHPGAAEEGDLMDDVLYVKVVNDARDGVHLLARITLSRLQQQQLLEWMFLLLPSAL